MTIWDRAKPLLTEKRDATDLEKIIFRNDTNAFGLDTVMPTHTPA